MSFNDDLRESNKRLIQQLQESQNQIRKLIISSKHSDPVLYNKMPLTSTLFNNGLIKTSQNPLSDKTNEKYSKIKPPKVTKALNINTNQDQNILNDVGNIRPVGPANIDKGTLHKEVFTAVETMKNPAKTSVRFEFKKSSDEIDDHCNETDVILDEENRPPPLLGYDWIADDVENQNNVQHFSESFMEEMKQFRKINRSECHSRQQYSEIMKTPKTPKTQSYGFDRKSPRAEDLYESRIVNYTVNDRLFPVPVNANEKLQQGSEKSPRYIRVSIPKSSLSSPYRFAFNHRRMNTREDSLALPHHCAMGLQTTLQTRSLTDASALNLDLRASLRPPDEVTKLQLKSGQAQIPQFTKTATTSSSLLDESYALQYEHQKLRKMP